MRLSCEFKSSPGPVREKNEDYLGFWQPEDEAERLQRGAIAVVADGVGGLQNGEVASKMAVEIAIATFQRMNPANTPKQILKQIFDTANIEIYEAGMSEPKAGRMATTLSV
jgi:protein phosphatase